MPQTQMGTHSSSRDCFAWSAMHSHRDPEDVAHISSFQRARNSAQINSSTGKIVSGICSRWGTDAAIA